MKFSCFSIIHYNYITWIQHISGFSTASSLPHLSIFYVIDIYQIVNRIFLHWKFPDMVYDSTGSANFQECRARQVSSPLCQQYTRYLVLLNSIIWIKSCIFRFLQRRNSPFLIYYRVQFWVHFKKKLLHISQIWGP